MSEINVETFEYDDGKMKAFSWSRYVPTLSLLEQLRYDLNRDAEGYFSTYTVKDLNKPDLESNELEAYKVLARRR